MTERAIMHLLCNGTGVICHYKCPDCEGRGYLLMDDGTPEEKDTNGAE